MSTDTLTLELLYHRTRGRIAGLLAGPAEEAGELVVSACPSWRVRDVLAHLTGLCADVLAGNIAGAATDDWTAAQVEARRDRSVADVLAEWDELAGPFAAMIDQFPGWYGRQVGADITVHEQELRGALGQPGARTAEGMGLALGFLLSGIAHPGGAALGLGPVEVVSADRSWLVGSAGSGAGDPDGAIATVLLSGERPSPTGEPAVARVAGSPFELCRALTGRRSPDQIRRLEWTGDPSPWLPVFAQGPFTLRTTDLDE